MAHFANSALILSARALLQHGALPANFDAGHLAGLASRLALDPHENCVLGLLAALELDPECRRLASLDAAARPTIGLLLGVCYPDDPGRGVDHLSEHGRLFRYALVETIADTAGAALVQQELRAAPRVVELAVGLRRLDSAVAAIAEIDRQPEAKLVLEGNVVEQVQQAWSQPGWIILEGSRGSGRRSVAALASRSEGRDALTIDARSIANEQGAALRQLRAINREATILGLDVIVTNAHELTASGESSDRIAWLEAELRGRVILTTTRSLPRKWRSFPRIIKVPPLGPANGARLWNRVLGGILDEDAQRIAASHPLAPARIVEAGRNALALRGDGELELDHIYRGIDMLLQSRVGDLAQRIDVTQSWADIVLDEEQHAGISDVLARLEGRRQVLEEWGFGDKIGRGRGMCALFSGPPGTGKTMAAGLIAKQLGLPLYQVDLSKIQSKWIGETEKNLAALFDAAEEGAAMLLFDEADSLFAKRTDVSTSNDRHANALVNYLLQRVESFTGACVLTTNHEKGIDEAFRRRLATHVRFTLPEADERASIWRAMLPATAPQDEGLDFSLLARSFEMSGGYIKNAVMRAAYRAAAEGGSISTKLLLSAAEMESEAMGKVIVATPAAPRPASSLY